MAALHLAQRDAERIWKYKDLVSTLNFSGISLPVKLVDIPIFEKQNEISVNVFGYERSKVFPIHVTRNKYDRHVNLLMISDHTNG